MAGESFSMRQFYLGSDAKEAIICLSGIFFLAKRGGFQEIGYSKIEAQEKLKRMGKNENFPDFMKI